VPAIVTVLNPVCWRWPAAAIGPSGALAERSARRPSWNTWNATFGA